MRHRYYDYTAGYYGNDMVTLPRFPTVFYSAVCPRCFVTVSGPASGICVKTEQDGDEVVTRILGNHACMLDNGSLVQ